MAVQTTRALPAQFIEDLGQDYGKQLAALTQLPVQTGMYRQVQYKVIKEERGLRFKVARTYDYAKQ